MIMSMNKFKPDVRQLSRLARVALTDEEAALFQEQLASLMTCIDGMNAIDVSGIEPTLHVAPRKDALRPDEPGPCLAREQALDNAPRQDGEFFLAPPIIS